MKKLINFVLILALGIILGWVFQPTIDKKVTEKSPKTKEFLEQRQSKWNDSVQEKMDSIAENRKEKAE